MVWGSGILTKSSEVYKTEPCWKGHYIPPNFKSLLSALICCDAWERCSSPALGFHRNCVKWLKPRGLGLNFYFCICSWVMLKQLKQSNKGPPQTTDSKFWITKSCWATWKGKAWNVCPVLGETIMESWMNTWRNCNCTVFMFWLTWQIPSHIYPFSPQKVKAP